MPLYNTYRLKPVRQKLRSNPPEPEIRLWNAIRNRQCAGVKFRRQCSIGRSIVDFYSFDRKLVIEIDGDSHYSPNSLAGDQERDAYLQEQGIIVIRFTNLEITQNLSGCFDHLEHFLLTGEMWER